jgi:hypothetical protein
MSQFIDAEAQTEIVRNGETTDDVCKELVSNEEFVKCKRFEEMAEERIRYLNTEREENDKIMKGCKTKFGSWRNEILS